MANKWRKGIATSSWVISYNLFSLHYFKIGEPRSPDCNDKKNSLLGTKRKCSCNVSVNNIVLFVTVSRHVIHHDNMYSFQPLHLNFVPYIVLEEIRRENGQKGSSERFSVLCAKFRDRSLFLVGVGVGWKNHGVGQAYFILETRGGPKEIFTMVGGGSLCVL